MSSQLRWGTNKYQDNSSRMSPALLRARQKYARRNIITGVLISGFVAAIYTYAATAAGSDDFSDVPLPPLPETVIDKKRKENSDKA
ncbi:hypothetical protein V1512DRAFT_245020 [Lipomyces arxii]|uniref:uncharacterized protein n=1 Tax=Lipomyces arxii TaxID=56418 RepID=UPI0034CED1DA